MHRKVIPAPFFCPCGRFAPAYTTTYIQNHDVDPKHFRPNHDIDPPREDAIAQIVQCHGFASPYSQPPVSRKPAVPLLQGDNVDDYRFAGSTILAALMRTIGPQCELRHGLT